MYIIYPFSKRGWRDELNNNLVEDTDSIIRQI